MNKSDLIKMRESITQRQGAGSQQAMSFDEAKAILDHAIKLEEQVERLMRGEKDE